MLSSIKTDHYRGHLCSMFGSEPGRVCTIFIVPTKLRDLTTGGQMKPCPPGLFYANRRSGKYTMSQSLPLLGRSEQLIMDDPDMSNQALIVTLEVLQEISVLRSEPKFHENGLYPGAPSEKVRQQAEDAVNATLDRLILELPGSPWKSYVLSEFVVMLKAFENADTEDREQACFYCERIMDILGIESSDGLLNNWLYGFDPGDKP